MCKTNGFTNIVVDYGNASLSDFLWCRPMIRHSINAHVTRFHITLHEYTQGDTLLYTQAYLLPPYVCMDGWMDMMTTVRIEPTLLQSILRSQAW